MTRTTTQPKGLLLYKSIGICLLLFGLISLFGNVMNMIFNQSGIVFVVQSFLRNGICIIAGILLLLRHDLSRYALLAYGAIGLLSQLYFFGRSLTYFITDFSGYQIASFFSSCMYLILGLCWTAFIIGLAMSKELREELHTQIEATGLLSYRAIGLLGAVYIVAPGLIEFGRSFIDIFVSIIYGYGGDNISNTFAMIIGAPLALAAFIGVALLFMRNKIGSWVLIIVAAISSLLVTAKWVLQILQYSGFGNSLSMMTNMLTDLVQITMVGIILLFSRYTYKVYTRGVNEKNTAEEILDGDFV